MFNTGYILIRISNGFLNSMDCISWKLFAYICSSRYTKGKLSFRKLLVHKNILALIRLENSYKRS